MKQESDSMPSKEYILEMIDDQSCDVVLNDLDNIEEVTIETETGTRTAYRYFSSRLKMQNSDNIDEYIESNYERLLNDAKEQARDKLADEVRKKRNKLLEESDQYMAFDRLGLVVTDSISLTNIVTVLKNFFNCIKKVTNGDWAKYRQALRDIPEQEGFPYNVVFPEKPKE